MKKSIFLFVMALTFVLSSVAFAQCTLNRQQWGLLGYNGRVEYYIDLQSVKNDGSIVEAESCFYFPTGVECGVKHRGNKNEHYHFLLYYINYNFNSAGLRAYTFRDSFGNEITSDYFEDDEFTYDPIPRNSLFEKFCITALKIAGRL